MVFGHRASAIFAVAGCALIALNSNTAFAAAPKNFIILYGDDQGVGDYFHPGSYLPHVRQLMGSGLWLANHYSNAAICSPSRGALLTSRIPQRLGIYSNKTAAEDAVFSPLSIGGLPLTEVTLANLLGDAGYATAAIGKWHLGTDEFHPVNRGFQQYRGILSTQNECVSNIRFPGSAIPGHTAFGACPYFVNGTIASQGDVDVLNIDTPYNEFASTFIKENAANDKPFFLYFGSHHTHAPQFAGDDLLNATARGLFGDSQAEFDRSVGVLIDAINAAGIADTTAIFVSADNGPSKHWFQLGGNAGQYKCGKGTTYEGGLRVPTVFWAPGVVQNPGGSSEALTSMVDFFPTILGWAGVEKPSNLTIDGVDISSVLSSPLLPPPGRQKQQTREQAAAASVSASADGSTGPYDPYGPYLPPAQSGPREAVYMWRGNTLMAVRAGNFKAHWWTRGWAGDKFSFPQNPECYAALEQHDPPLLFDVANDAAEFYPLNATNPSYAPIVAYITQLKVKQEADVVFAPSQTDLGSSPDRFPCCNPTCTPRPFCCKCE